MSIINNHCLCSMGIRITTYSEKLPTSSAVVTGMYDGRNILI